MMMRAGMEVWENPHALRCLTEGVLIQVVDSEQRAVRHSPGTPHQTYPVCICNTWRNPLCPRRGRDFKDPRFPRSAFLAGLGLRQYASNLCQCDQGRFRASAPIDSHRGYFTRGIHRSLNNSKKNTPRALSPIGDVFKPVEFIKQLLRRARGKIPREEP